MKTKQKGSFTIEATIVISAMLIALCAVMYAFMIMYQNVVIIYAASYGAQQGARSWVNSGISLDGSIRGYNSEIYSGVVEVFGGDLVNTKKQNIKAAVNEKLKMSVFSTDSAIVKIDFENNILQRKVIVDIKQTIPIPFSEIVKFFNHGEAFALKAKMEATIVEPAEYIRNIDYAVEWICSIGKWLGGYADKAAQYIKGLK